jgi:hypothetical protein
MVVWWASAYDSPSFAPRAALQIAIITRLFMHFLLILAAAGNQAIAARTRDSSAAA